MKEYAEIKKALSEALAQAVSAGKLPEVANIARIYLSALQEERHAERETNY